MTIFMDMDGVACDFMTGLAELMGKPEHGTFGPCPPSGYKLGDVFPGSFRAIERRGAAFWTELLPYPWWAGWDTSDVYYLTRPTFSPSSTAGKIGWLKKQHGHDFTRYIVTAHKGLLARRSSDVLIDDSDRVIQEWREAGGTGFLWPMPWNVMGRLPTADDIRHVSELLSVTKTWL